MGNVVHQFRRTLLVVDRNNQHPGLFDAGRMQQVRAHGIAEEYLDTERAQHLELFRLVVEHDGPDAGGQQDAIDDAAEPPVAGNNDVTGFVDIVRCFFLCFHEARRDQLVVDDKQRRRQQHRQRDDQQELLRDCGRDDGARDRKGQQHEAELARLRQSQGKQPSIGAADPEYPGENVEHRRLDCHDSQRHADDAGQVLRQQVEADGRADGNEEEAQ